MGVEAAWLTLLVVFLVLAWVTIGGIVRAARNGDNGWVIGIIAGWLVGVGWLVGAIYLLTHPSPESTTPRGPGSAPSPSSATAHRTSPGWYPDPSNRHEHRYWDGARWTEHVASGGQTSTDPL